LTKASLKDPLSFRTVNHNTTTDAPPLLPLEHLTAGTMWRRVYFLLILVRIYFALSPSYLHPDENFQGPEVIAGTFTLMRGAYARDCD
jgi:hypothetical protein